MERKYRNSVPQYTNLGKFIICRIKARGRCGECLFIQAIFSPYLGKYIFQRIHLNYERRLLPFLKKTGYLERSSYRYSKVYGICCYYRINGYKFIMDNPAPKPKRESKAQAWAEAVRSYKREHPAMSNRAIARALGMWKFFRGWNLHILKLMDIKTYGILWWRAM
jgi:hypothetical protein